MSQLFHIATKHLTSTKFDHQFAEYVCYVIGIVVLVLGLLKVTSMGLDEDMLLIGIFSVLSFSMLIILMGMIQPLLAARYKQE